MDLPTPQEMNVIVDAIAKADADGGFGFDFISPDGDDVTIRQGGVEDVLNFSIQNGIVLWCDFTHATPIGPIDNLDELSRKFKEMFRLSGDSLQNWINEQPNFFTGCDHE